MCINILAVERYLFKYNDKLLIFILIVQFRYLINNIIEVYYDVFIDRKVSLWLLCIIIYTTVKIINVKWLKNWKVLILVFSIITKYLVPSSVRSMIWNRFIHMYILWKSKDSLYRICTKAFRIISKFSRLDTYLHP